MGDRVIMRKDHGKTMIGPWFYGGQVQPVHKANDMEANDEQ